MTDMGAANILWLGDMRCGDPAVSGGKAARLSRHAVSQRVPPGFCLTASALEREGHGASLRRTDKQEVPLSRPLRDDLGRAYRRLGELCGQTDPNVAVRSSALEEDGATASFAGQFETYLNVNGIDAVADAVVRCRRSAGGARVQEYRLRRGLPPSDGRLAVLIQQLIVADISAVLFSANPIRGSREELIVTATWGLGESLVGGAVTPDTYVVRKADLVVLSRQVAQKRRMTVAVPGGIEDREVPHFLQHQATLDDDLLRALARLALTLEADQGAPVDVECALRAGQVFLLQCRPVTGLLAPSSGRRGVSAPPR
jgi:phosphoenolpyruvate synthase/pyruvate phosphate dikinase